MFSVPDLFIDPTVWNPCFGRVRMFWLTHTNFITCKINISKCKLERLAMKLVASCTRVWAFIKLN